MHTSNVLNRKFLVTKITASFIEIKATEEN